MYIFISIFKSTAVKLVVLLILKQQQIKDTAFHIMYAMIELNSRQMAETHKCNTYILVM